MVAAGEVIRASDVAVQAARVTRTTAQSIADNTLTTVAFNDEVFDTDGMHSNSTNNSRVTINTAGFYVIGFNGTFAAGNDYTRVMTTVLVNGATEIAREQASGTSSNVQQTCSVTTVYQFDAGDYVEAQVYQDNTASAARNLEVTADRSPQLWVARLGS